MIFTFLSDCASAQINFIILKHSHPPLILHWASPPPFFKSLKHTAYSFFHHLACTPPTLQLSMSTCQQLKRWKDLPVIDIQMIPSIYFRSVSLFFHFQLTPCKKLCKSDKKRGKKRCYSLAVAPSLHLFSCWTVTIQHSCIFVGWIYSRGHSPALKGGIYRKENIHFIYQLIYIQSHFKASKMLAEIKI